MLTSNFPQNLFVDNNFVICSTLKQLEMHGCILSTLATDALVLKHQAISIHSADKIFIVLDHFHAKILHLQWTRLENKITFFQKKMPLFQG